MSHVSVSIIIAHNYLRCINAFFHTFLFYLFTTNEIPFAPPCGALNAWGGKKIVNKELSVGPYFEASRSVWWFLSGGEQINVAPQTDIGLVCRAGTSKGCME